MLTQLDIDTLKKEIDDNEFAYIYYIAHMVETREGVIDENQYKSVNRFKVLKLKIDSIVNAYIEYLNFKNNPDNYHIEEEIEIYDAEQEFIHYYTVPNTNDKSKDFNSRMPSIIYGYTRKDVKSNTYMREPSLVKPIYTNTLELCGNVIDTFNDSVSWKYIKASESIKSDGVLFKYMTSDWYIINVTNFPRSEKTLIKVNDSTCYFTNPEDALSYMEQLEA